MGEVTECPACLLAWGGHGRRGLLRKHECLGTATPSVHDLLAYLGVVTDDHSCLIPTSVYARPARGGGQHWWLPSAAIRIVGEQYAHRAILRLRLGRPLRASLVAAHECAAPYYENPQCVNPEHLHERSRQENALWMSPARRSEVLGGPNKADRLRELNRSRTGTPLSPDHVERIQEAKRRKKLTAGGSILPERWAKT